jgi:hypothetical protein
MKMMTKQLQTIALVLSLTILSVSSVGYGQEAEIVLDNPDAYASNQRTAVTFSHELHMEAFDCLECHHDYAEGENALDEGELEEGNPAIRCASCHGSGSTPELRCAYHRQCMGCHRLMRIKGLATGPELCGGCHIK